MRQGFTLIELSIVLVIIGLIVGGILVGQDLIKAAEVRSQITQIEKYNQAVNTFRVKFGGLPGDITPAAVSQFGFTTASSRAGGRGRGDSNGLIESYYYAGPYVGGSTLLGGENAFFWEDLSVNGGGLIYSAYNAATDAQIGISLNTDARITQYLPAAKIGNGNYINAYSNGSLNYYEIVSIAVVDPNGTIRDSVSMNAWQAYNIDKKMDDGMPQSGVVAAQYSSWFLGGMAWAAGGGTPGQGVAGTAGTAATPQTSTTCFDNAGVAGNGQQYSLGTLANYGSGINCALSFKFQ